MQLDDAFRKIVDPCREMNKPFQARSPTLGMYRLGGKLDLVSQREMVRRWSTPVRKSLASAMPWMYYTLQPPFTWMWMQPLSWNAAHWCVHKAFNNYVSMKLIKTKVVTLFGNVLTNGQNFQFGNKWNVSSPIFDVADKWKKLDFHSCRSKNPHQSKSIL